MQTYDEVIAAAGGVAAFQASQGLTADGVAGPRTNNAVLRVMLGLQPLRLPSASSGGDGIRRPDCDKVYGEFSFTHWAAKDIKTDKDKGRVIIDPAWEAANLIEGNLWDGQKIRLHKEVWAELDFIFKAAAEASGYHPKYTVGYKPRHTLWKPEKSLSSHSWGCAIDFDCDDNDLGGVDAKGNPSKMRKNPKFGETFKHWGWTWGGDWGIKDDMHYQRAFV